LGDVFRDAVNEVFIETDPMSGDRVGYLLQDQFGVFEDWVDPDRLLDVVEQILQSGIIDYKDAMDLPDYGGSFRVADEEWETDLIDRVTSWNGKTGDPLAPFWVALDDMSETVLAGTTVYRARLHDDRTSKVRYTPADLGAPPPAITPPGRANRKGVPVLYAAKEEVTAIREVRPWIGCAMAVAEIQLARDVRIVDATPRQIVNSPFFDELIRWKANLPGLIYAFATELSRPVGPNESHRYEPTQRMCEMIKAGGYEGIRYPSALGPGSNLVFFEPAVGRVIDVHYLRAQSVDLGYEPVDDGDSLYDESPFDNLFETTDSPPAAPAAS
jgi:RES domain-containing protein